ncbi:response regulator transcription factor [Anaerocolumna aminovalerica]|uniref:response regulator transcription factor n=1 Tax=Anaerocolumna aminovalerica TaxID=1527 RepID=UPI00248CF775|nr:response regulator [Anaerocolumna aminovalerica]
MYKILITDDEKSEREVILYLISKYNFKLEVLQAANGRDALEMLATQPIDILLTDIQMPFLNGMELAAKARSINPNIEIIFFSGYDDFAYVKTALSLRAVNYILKPVNPDEFNKTISEVINTLQSRESAKAESEKYIKEHFYLNTYQNNKNNNSNNENVMAAESQDSELLNKIAQAIQLKDIDTLRRNTNLLLEKYKNIPNVSHIYIRYLCTTLLQLFINALPEADDNDFKKVVEEIYSFRYFADIYKLLINILEKVIDQFKAENQSHRHAILLVEQYILSHYTEDLSLNTLANIVFLSPKYLSSLFIQVTGISLNRYIKNVRIEKAKELLLNTNMKIADICKEVGYSYVSYFCRIFQEDYGMSPDRYRQTRGQGE